MVIYIAILEIDERLAPTYSDYMSYTDMIYIIDRHVWRGIYGFTTKKNLFSTFINMRTGLIEDKINIDEYEYEDFVKKHKESLIEKRYIEYSKSYSIKLPMTFREYVQCTEYSSESYWSEISSIVKINPNIFNSKWRNHLTNIGYTIHWTEIFGDSSDSELLYYNASHGVGIIPTPCQLGIFCLIYKNIINVNYLNFIILKEVKNNNVKKNEDPE